MANATEIGMALSTETEYGRCERCGSVIVRHNKEEMCHVRHERPNYQSINNYTRPIGAPGGINRGVNGCGGICIQYDTGACACRCDGFAAGTGAYGVFEASGAYGEFETSVAYNEFETDVAGAETGADGEFETNAVRAAAVAAAAESISGAAAAEGISGAAIAAAAKYGTGARAVPAESTYAAATYASSGASAREGRQAGACAASGAGACENLLAGVCCKQYLRNCAYSSKRVKDGGDYRSFMGKFVSRLRIDGIYDEGIRDRLSAEAAKADAYRDKIWAQAARAADKTLFFEWPDFKLSDLFEMFPGANQAAANRATANRETANWADANRAPASQEPANLASAGQNKVCQHTVRLNPVRIEIQLLIYMFHNFRYPIDLEFTEDRFLVDGQAINRYLRAYYGYSYTSLLAKIRNEYSKLLLRIPQLRIGEIGLLAGYKTNYHYSLNFKRYEGMSPKEYRRSLRD